MMGNLQFLLFRAKRSVRASYCAVMRPVCEGRGLANESRFEEPED